MDKNIKRFTEFRSIDEKFDISSLFGNLGEVGSDLLKSKAAEFLIGFIGVSSESLLGTIISKAAQQMSFAEYWDIVSGKGNFPVSKIAPKLADATIEIFTDQGIDGIASKLNSTIDKSGLIYRAFKELLTNQSRKSDFRENLIQMWTLILTAGGSLKTKKSAFNFTKKDVKTLLKDPEIKSKGIEMSDILKSLTGGSSTSDGRGLIGEQ